MSSEQLFDLSLTEEQRLTRDVVSRFAREEMASVARSADEAAELPAGFLDKTLDLGLNYLSVPEVLGGLEAGRCAVSNVLSFEDLAQGDMSMAIAALAPLAVINALLDYGSESQQQMFIPQLLASSFQAASIAHIEPGLGAPVGTFDTRATQSADDSYVLNGLKSMVAFGPECRLIIVVCELAGEPAAFLVPTDTDGLGFEKEDYMGLRPLPLYRMQLDNVRVSGSSRLEGFDLQAMYNRGKLAAAALAVGTCQAVLDYVVPYVNERQAFGEPISNRQAVAFMVADMATELEGMRLLAYRAAGLADQGLDYQQAAYLAHRSAVKYGMKIGTDGVQLLGGHGFTREHPVELWYRNLRALPLLDGVLLA